MLRSGMKRSNSGSSFRTLQRYYYVKKFLRAFKGFQILLFHNNLNMVSINSLQTMNTKKNYAAALP